MLANRIRMAAGLCPIEIPAGLIVILNTTTAPEGWTPLTGIGRFLIGAGGSFGVGATGGAYDVSGVASTTSGGHRADAHSHGGYVYMAGAHYSEQNNPALVAGAHSHTCSFSNVYPAGIRLMLFKALAELQAFPPETVLMAPQTITGFSDYGANAHYGYLDPQGGAIPGATIAQNCNVSQTSAGNHHHFSGTGHYTYYYALTATTGGQHGDHVISSLTVNFAIKTALLHFQRSIESFRLHEVKNYGVIALWDGPTIPSGWYLCDGQHGTPDLRDCFVKVDNTVTGDGRVSGSGGVSIGGTLSTHSFTHSHLYGGYYVAEYNTYSYLHSASVSHSHTFSRTDPNYLPQYYALKFIQLGG